MAPEEMDNIQIPHGLRIDIDWPSLTPQAGAAISAFWQHENAIVDAVTASKRLPEVVAHTLAELGEVAALCPPSR